MNIAKKSVVEGAITFTWADETSTTVNVADFSDEIKYRACVHGFSQKLGDSYSGVKSVTEAKAKFDVTLKGLIEGDWNRKGIATGGMMVEAIARATGADLETVLGKWNEADEATRKTWVKHPDVVRAKAELDLERAKAKAKESEPLSI